MTNDLPDALIEKVADILASTAFVTYRIPGSNPELNKTVSSFHQREKIVAEQILQALDISGIISDLRFYGDDTEQGQRARTRLEKLTTTKQGE